MFFLLAAHLFLNYAAVKAVKLRTINRQRANILFSNLVETDTVLRPKHVAERESIFERRGGSVLRWLSGSVLGYCEFGVSLRDLLECLPQSHVDSSTKSTRLPAIELSTITNLFQNQQYLLWCQPHSPRCYESSAPQVKVLVVLKQGITPESQLRAWFHALLISRRLSEPLLEGKNKALQEELLDHIAESLDRSNKTFDSYARRLRMAGWELDIPVLETRLGSRIAFESQKAHAQI